MALEKRLSVIEKAWALPTETGSHQKELMLIEVLSLYNHADNGALKGRIIHCLSKWSSTQILLQNVVAELGKFLNDHLEELLNEHVDCVLQIISIPSFKHYLKENDKKTWGLFEKIEETDENLNEKTSLILNILLSLGLSTEKGTVTFLKKGSANLARYFAGLEKFQEPKQQALDILKSLFNKNAYQKLNETVDLCFAGVEENQNNLRIFQSLHNCYTSDLEVNHKIAYFRFIFDALTLTPHTEDTFVLKFFAIISHILAIPATKFIKVKDISPKKASSNLKIWSAILYSLSKRSINFNIELNEQSLLHWLRSVTGLLITEKDFGATHMEVLTALVQLDSSIIEPYLSKIFSQIFGMENQNCQQLSKEFLSKTLAVFSRSQRTHKFLKKLLDAVGPESSQQVLSEDFLNQLGQFAVVISGAQALSLIQLLQNMLHKCTCTLIGDQLHTMLLEMVSLLFCTVLTNCRLIDSALPRSVVASFIEIMELVKENLRELGRLILQRTHDRQVMQPFLRMCHVWGEYHVLTSLYATEDGPPSLTTDATPSDLSPILPFLKGEQWCILSERIANFGDHQCNQLLMKLLILKIRVAYLSGVKSSVNLEAIAKYILEILKQNVHGLKINHAMSPEEYGFVFNALPADKTKTLVKILYDELITSDDVIFKSWMKNNILLENPKFVEIIFDTIVRDICNNMEQNDLQLLLRKSDLNHISEDLKVSVNAALCEGNTNKENKLNDRVGKSLSALTGLPFGYIASFGENPLIIILGVMAALNTTKYVLLIFEKLLTHATSLDKSFDVNACIRWLIINVSDRRIRGPIIEQLVVKSTSTDEGLSAFKQLIKNLDSDCDINDGEKLATRVLFHNAIRKCWRQGNDDETTHRNDLIAKQRKKLNKSLHNALENTTIVASDCVLLDAYAIELMRLEREGKVEGIVAINFQSYLNVALKGVRKSINDPNQQSCLNFLTTVLKCSTALRQATTDQNFVFAIYKKLTGVKCPSLWEHVCTAATEKEFQSIMNDVSQNVQIGLCPTDLKTIAGRIPDELQPLFLKLYENKKAKQWSDHYINIWKIFLQKVKGEKQTICFNHLKRILTKFPKLWPNTKNSQSLLLFLHFLHYVVTLSILAIRPELEDYVMDVIMASPETETDFQDHFVAQLNIIGALIAPQKIPAVRKMHMIFLVYQKLVQWLSRESDTNGNLSANDVSSRALAAFHLEKWIGLLVQRKDEFQVFPMFITELINSTANFSVYPSVKTHIRNAVFQLLGVMDELQVKSIARNLGPGCQQILKNLHSEFVKFHKYKGKI